MRDDLSPAFLAEIEKENRAPVTLCEFHFPDGIRRLSDQPFTLEMGWAYEWEPIVENWGNLRDNVRIEPIIGGQSLEVRQMSISIINMGDPPFSQKFKDINPENVKVYIYQWFADLDPDDLTLIDIMVCQDPIVVSEAQALVRIQLVSPIMTQNPFIWGPNRFVEVRYPMVLGKWRTVARSMETGPTALLLYDIDQNFTGEVFLDFNTGVATWPDPPFNVFIDSEQLRVDSMDISKMNIVARGQAGTVARPHIRGALVCDPAANYDYSLTAGPVGAIENLLGDDEEYNNPYTVFPGEDPAYIRFVGRPPWHSVEAGEPGVPILPPEETTTQYGTANETYIEVVTNQPSGPGNINNAGSNVVMSIDNTIGEQPGEIYSLEKGVSWVADKDGVSKATINTPDQVNKGGRGSVRWFVDNNVQNPTLSPGVTFEIGSHFDRDLPSENLPWTPQPYEDFISCYITCTATFNARGQQGTGTVLISIDGAETVIWTLGSIGNQNPASSFTDLVVPIQSVTGIIKSWSDLERAKVICRFECTYQSAWSGSTGRRWEFDVYCTDVQYHLFYTYTDPEIVPTYPLQQTVSHFNRDLSSLGAFVSLECLVRFDCSAINCSAIQRIIFRTDNDPANDQVLWSRALGPGETQGMATQFAYPSVGSMAALRTARVGVEHQVTNPVDPGDRRVITTNIQYVQWKVTYQPGAIDQPDEERVVYVNELTADVTSNQGENITPARAIQGLLDSVGNLTEYIDTDNFDEYHALYDEADYYFNGLIDGETRFHDALKSLIRQGSTRIAYNAGKIYLVSNFLKSLDPIIPDPELIESVRSSGLRAVIQQDQELQFIFKPDQRQRSVTQQRMRFNDVRNKITIRYKPDYKLDEWLGELEVKDDESINSIGEQEESLDYPYVSNDDIISDIGDRLLELKGSPQAFDTFRVYFKAFPFEKGDQIWFETDFNDYFGAIGQILTINRVFGSGKAGRMNIFEVTIMSNPIVAHRLLIQDALQVNEELTNFVAFSIEKLIEENVVISDTLTNTPILNLFLDISETVEIGEQFSTLKGVEKDLLVQEFVNVNDAWSYEEVLPLLLELSDQINVGDQLDRSFYTVHNLLVRDEVQIREDAVLRGTIGYGLGEYGEGGYGGALNFQLVTHRGITIDQVTHVDDDVIHYPS